MGITPPSLKTIVSYSQIQICVCRYIMRTCNDQKQYFLSFVLTKGLASLSFGCINRLLVIMFCKQIKFIDTAALQDVREGYADFGENGTVVRLKWLSIIYLRKFYLNMNTEKWYFQSTLKLILHSQSGLRVKKTPMKEGEYNIQDFCN